MAKKILNIKIDVSKIDKSRLFVGEKGTYLDAVCFLSDEKDSYGHNGMIVQQITKEERLAKVQGNILGNVSVYVPTGAAGDTVEAPADVKAQAIKDLPF